MVGVERFELPTSCTQSRRATRLRYTPNFDRRMTARARDDTGRIEQGQTLRSISLMQGRIPPQDCFRYNEYCARG